MKVDRETLQTGIPLIDRQHGEYFDRLDRLLQMAETGHVQRDQLKSEMDGLLMYAIEHFDAEESLMRSVQYPLYQKHSAKHSSFRDTMDQWNLELNGEEVNLDRYAVRMATGLMVWVCDQIRTDDRQLAAFLKDRARPAAGSV